MTRILVIDSDPDSGRFVQLTLELEGFDVEVACNGEDALDKARAHTPSVIVLDMMMPVMDGWAFCARQRGDAVLAEIPVVILSAAPMERLTNLGAAAVLQKPFEYQGLISAVRANC